MMHDVMKQWEAMKRLDADLMLFFAVDTKELASGGWFDGRAYVAFGSDGDWLRSEFPNLCQNEGDGAAFSSAFLEFILDHVVIQGRRAAVCERREEPTP